MLIYTLSDLIGLVILAAIIAVAIVTYILFLAFRGLTKAKRALKKIFSRQRKRA